MNLRKSVIYTTTVTVFILVVLCTVADGLRNNFSEGILQNDYGLNDSSEDTTRQKLPHLQDNNTFTEKPRKCFCDGGKVYHYDKCVPTSAKVPVYDPKHNTTTMVDTTQFQRVWENPQCPDGQVLSRLVSTLDTDQLHLLPNGHLFWQQRQLQLYCIELIRNDIKSLTLEANVCMKPSALASCCPQNYTLSANLSCTENNSHPLILSAYAHQVQVDMMPGKMEEVNCLSHQNLKILHDEEVFLKYSPDRVSLVWSPSHCLQKEQTEQFCVGQQEGKDGYIAQVCSVDKIARFNRQCSNSTCVRKCCDDQEIIIDGTVCTSNADADELWTPSFYDYQEFSPNATAHDNIKVISLCPSCEQLIVLPQSGYEDNGFILLNNGDLYRPAHTLHYPPTDYCIDNFRDMDGVIRTKALVCTREQHVCKALDGYVYPALMLLSCVFLAATLIIHTTVPGLHNNLFGKCLISMVVALLVGYLTMAILALTKSKISKLPCTILALLKQFSLLAAFFWQNILWFDVYSITREMHKVNRDHGWIRRRFLQYSLYSWGIPFIITLVTILVETLADPNSFIIRPTLDSYNYCWFGTEESKWVYFFGIMAVLLIFNCILFVLVVLNVCCNNANMIMTRKQEVKRDRVWLCVKLFVVMGLLWLADIASWQHGNSYVWVVLNVINCLQGVFIFLVFVCKKKALEQVKAMMGKSCRQSTQSSTSRPIALSTLTTDPVNLQVKESSISAPESQTNI